MKKILALVLALSLLAVSAMALADGDTFKLGWYFGLTGGNSAYGIECFNGVKLGVDYINQNGGLNGKQIELIGADTQCSPEEAQKIATKLINDDHVDACIGSMNSGEVTAAAKFFNEAGIYHIGCGTAHSWMQEDWPFVFRAAMDNDFAVPIAAALLPKLGYETVAIFNGQEDASIGTANAFEAKFKELGVEVVDRESYSVGDTDYSAQIAKMLSYDPDCVCICVIGEVGGPLVNQLRLGGYDGIILDKESFMDSQIEIAGKENSNYIMFSNPYVTYKSVDDCDIPNMKEYLQLYLDTYGTMVATDSAYRGWDSMMVLAEAAKIAGANDSESLRAATHKVVIPGLGGELNYTLGNREGYNTFNSFILVDGKNLLFDDWFTNGGYEAYLADTGLDK
jgi:branched-chain amino acid transport system substrate-binding protein